MDLEATVDRLHRAADERDWDTWLSVFTPTAGFRLHPGEEMSPAEALAMTKELAQSGVTWSYSNAQRIVAGDALVEQRDTTLTAPDGQSVTVEACVVFRFEAGLISRFDEYIDIASLTPFLDRPSP